MLALNTVGAPGNRRDAPPGPGQVEAVTVTGLKGDGPGRADYSFPASKPLLEPPRKLLLSFSLVVCISVFPYKWKLFKGLNRRCITRAQHSAWHTHCGTKLIQTAV